MTSFLRAFNSADECVFDDNYGLHLNLDENIGL